MQSPRPLAKSGQPTLLFGGGIVGDLDVSHFTSTESVATLLEVLQDTGLSRIDTAARYPGSNPGNSERLLGLAQAGMRGFVIDTKIMVSGGSGASGSLSLDAVRSSVTASLERLHVTKVNTLYAHAPDPTTPLEEQARAMDEQYKKGVCNQLGLCNFPPDLLEQWLQVCDEKGYTKPRVLQDRYNLLDRSPGSSLLPLCRRHDMAFIAYSPLAAGVLAGGLTARESMRFRPGSAVGNLLRELYDRPELRDKMRQVEEVLAARGVTTAEAALRWLCFHSGLGEGDGVILGASKPEQAVRNVEMIEKGPMPADLVKDLEMVWGDMSAAGSGG